MPILLTIGFVVFMIPLSCAIVTRFNRLAKVGIIVLGIGGIVAYVTSRLLSANPVMSPTVQAILKYNGIVIAIIPLGFLLTFIGTVQTTWQERKLLFKISRCSKKKS